ncbi:MAG: GIY-YIG nuclease family protein [Ignavibacteriaceae bacterium]
MSYFLYILESEKNKKFYVGISSDPYKRLYFHNTLEKGFTARYRPWKIVFVKEFGSKELASKIEKKIKSMKSHSYVEKIVNNEYNIDYILEYLSDINSKESN